VSLNIAFPVAQRVSRARDFHRSLRVEHSPVASNVSDAHKPVSRAAEQHKAEGNARNRE
jgi:hypothetical protein